MNANRTRRVAAIFIVALAIALCRPAGALTISEIHYNPSLAAETECGCNLEWIEIYNEDPTVVNLSGYRFTDGVVFEFPPDTYLEGRSYLVVCAATGEIYRPRGPEWDAPGFISLTWMPVAVALGALMARRIAPPEPPDEKNHPGR